ncbi:MAG: hypothetical protein COT74_04290 [Bdellovibrionales bacterium CG10_big_fil_rev_8_21_14_0_10_45_34]|nr:MAG: hypothetical protein COT74_04290 [Bdellovibrionales bacterium CG10_big_fil_rev_8_21_14_0_10_45_34]
MLATLIRWVYTLISFTWRREIHESQSLRFALKDNQKCIFAFWHGDELALVAYAKEYPLSAIVSQSKDGELMAKVLKGFGIQVTRGSSHRNGARALVGIIRTTKVGRIPAIAVDGPKGPIHVPKPGVFEISRHGGALIFPCAARSSRSYVFHKSWNKAFLPLPFSKVVLVFGEPMEVSFDQDQSRSEELAKELTLRINACSQLASNLIDSSRRDC